MHHLAKIVNGAPLVRPEWYYDTRVQGNGLVDITSHMCDQVQWMLASAPGSADYDYAADVKLSSAQTSDTEVPLSLFADNTGASEFPGWAAAMLRPSDPEGSGPLWAGGEDEAVLPLAANGVLEYSLRGVSVRHTAEWRPREPVGGGDLHSSTLRGTVCEVTVGCGPETNYKQELALRPLPEHVESFGAALEAAVERWQAKFEGVGAQAVADGSWILTIPTAISPSHEEHFAMVMEEFLDYIGGDGWPSSLTAAIRMRYTLLANAHALGEQSRAKH